MQHGGGAPSPQPLHPPPSDISQHGRPSDIPRPRWLTVSDAMAYLDAVKLEFRNQPEIYDEFLAIVGRFKTKEMLPPDVILEVARLFRGRNSLVLRFNRFLPDGYKIGPADIKRIEDAHVAEEQAAARTGLAVPDGSVLPIDGSGGAQLGRGDPLRDDAHGVPMGTLPASYIEGHGDGPDSTDGEEDEDDLHDSAQPFDFDHAVNYVTTIKKRFAGDPETYKAFLDVLHNYQRQREHNGGIINSVLEQVTDLFADHPDLLKEFTYFLPDGVQAEAKDKLDRAAEEAEIRLGLRSVNARLPNGQRVATHPSHAIFHPSHGRGRPAIGTPSRVQARSHRPLQKDQDWQEHRSCRTTREGSMHRGYHQGHTPHGTYFSGGLESDPPRGAMRHPYQGTSDVFPAQVDGYRSGRHGDRGEHHRRSLEREEYELGAEVPCRGPRKRGRVADFSLGQGSGRGWSSVDATGVFRSSPEHDLFNQARQVLSSGGDANDWNEFLKCLDLFSNQVMNREEMVAMVQELFENHNEVDLMEDFKSLINRRGSLEPLPRDSWPTTGLSEINFQSAKKCTPSYRELPRDYQMTCSGRNAAEEKVLNDRWVSVPVGSEDSNNFKHMRRNPHEDVLFKMEDERFELDMLIDGISAAIARLEPLEEEIEALRATTELAVAQQHGIFPEYRGASTSSPGSNEVRDAPPPRFQYRLDNRTLGALHMSTVSRLYGEHGMEVLDLMRKNPAATIPVVLKRLRQKEKEWRSSREKAKSAWKELAQRNFHRSLDHRSHHFRREDKRNTSSRALLQEIKDKKVEEDPQNAAVVKAATAKAQEVQEDPTFLLGRISPASTAAELESLSADADAATDSVRSDGGARDSPEIMTGDGENAPISGGRPPSKEGLRLLRQEAEDSPPWYMFAHLTLSYPPEETASIHSDIMELISHTLARRPPSEEDVRQASSMVVKLLPTFFVMKNSKCLSNGAETSSSSNTELDETLGANSAQEAMAMPALSSDEGSDNEDESDRGDGHNEVGAHKDGFPHIGDDERSCESRLPADKIRKHSQLPQDGGISGVEDGGHSRVPPIPLPEHQEVFFTTTDFYVALRMHHLLAERLAAAKRLCYEAKASSQTAAASAQQFLHSDAAGERRKDEESMAHEEESDKDSQELTYKTFLGHLYDLVEDKINSERYDEGVRQLVGNQGYVLCNLDKLVVGLLQNLYRASSDKIFSKLMQLYHYERSTQSYGVSPTIYRSHVKQLLRGSDKEIVRVQYHSGTSGREGCGIFPMLKMEYIGAMSMDRGRAEDSVEVDRDVSSTGDSLEMKSPVVKESAE